MNPLPLTFLDPLPIWENTVPGSAQWNDGQSSLSFICPCGCASYIRLPIKPPQEKGWQWNGNKNKPSLTPSILNYNCRWHGFLTD